MRSAGGSALHPWWSCHLPGRTLHTGLGPTSTVRRHPLMVPTCARPRAQRLPLLCEGMFGVLIEGMRWDLGAWPADRNELGPR